MAKTEVVMPQMGESITTGTITNWNKQPGDSIEIDEILLEISTDKVESEIPSPIGGKIVELKYPEGETVDVGKVIAIIDDDEDAEVADAPEASSSQSSEPPPAPTPSSSDASKTETKSAASNGEGERRFYTPLVKKLAAENNVPLSELANIEGTGAGGRVNKSDFETYLSSRGSAPSAASSSQASSPAPTAPTPSVPAYNEGERVEIVPMDNMRKAIAKNMQASKLTSPHVNSIDTIDMTNLVNFREGFKNEFYKQEGFKLTYTPFIMYALTQALKEFPGVNASIDGDNIVYKKDINMGCAVAVPGNGLIVPVIKNIDSLNMTGICRQLFDLSSKARAKKLTMDDLSGGTYTFTNNGSFGTLIATPVILQPQLAIFAAGVIKKQVAVMPGDQIAVRSLMYGIHTYDHRAVDGEMGGMFLASVKKHLETMDPSSLF